MMVGKCCQFVIAIFIEETALELPPVFQKSNEEMIFDIFKLLF